MDAKRLDVLVYGARFVLLDAPADGNCGAYVAAAIISHATGVSLSAAQVRALVAIVFKSPVAERQLRMDARGDDGEPIELDEFRTMLARPGEYLPFASLAFATAHIVYALSGRHVKVPVYALDNDSTTLTSLASGETLGEGVTSSWAFVYNEEEQHFQLAVVRDSI